MCFKSSGNITGAVSDGVDAVVETAVANIPAFKKNTDSSNIEDGKIHRVLVRWQCWRKYLSEQI